MDETIPKPFVFILMPFSADFDDIYKVGIKPACKDAGAYCERVDEQIFVESILERVYNQIAKADIIVAEMTNRNPNVFYETGYAHALNKRVILLTRNADDIPFDLKHYPHIVYGSSIAKLKQELETRIRWCVEHPKEPLSSVDINLQFFINGEALINNPEIELSVWRERFYNEFLDIEPTSFTVGVHNPSNRVINSEAFALALVTSPQLKFSTRLRRLREKFIRSIAPLPDGRNIVNLDFQSALFPHSWITLEILVESVSKTASDLLNGNAIRLFTAVGYKDYPFAWRLHIKGV